MKRDRNRARKPSLAGLISRFGLTERDLQDKRISGLVHRKLALDDEISQLIASGAREARIQRMAKLLRFTDEELARDHKISWLIQSVFDARQCLATLKPTTIKPGDANVSKR
jgi:hypothetical protein